MVFTETALAEYVSGPATGATGEASSAELPDLSTTEVEDVVPSIALATTDDTTEEKA